VHCKNPYTVQKLKDGSKLVTVNSLPVGVDYELKVGCGKCLWCRIQRRKDWTIRIAHESDFHIHRHFVTLTYNEDNLPYTESGIPTIRKNQLQRFYKRLRKEISKKAESVGEKIKIKHYSAGEYGDESGRPHYHAIVLGNPFPQLYQACWSKDKKPLGYVDVGTVTEHSILYTTKYIGKKQYGSEEYLKEYYEDREIEFQLQSQKMGLGYLEKNLEEIIENNYVRYKGTKQSIPRYYQKKILEMAPTELKLKFQENRIKKRIEQTAEELLEVFGGTPDIQYNLKAQEVVDENKKKKSMQMDLNLRSHQKIKNQGRQKI
jgi:hypothetical protein